MIALISLHDFFLIRLSNYFAFDLSGFGYNIFVILHVWYFCHSSVDSLGMQVLTQHFFLKKGDWLLYIK